MNLVQNTLKPRASANTVSLRNDRPFPTDHNEEAERLQEIGAQAAKIAHDLNNLLSPIIMSLGVFRPHLENENHLAMLDIAKKGALRATDLVGQILSFARGTEAVRKQMDPGVVFQEIAAFVRSTFPSSLEVHVEAPQNLAPIAANATQLHQALLNLCVNARDAMPNGGALTLRATNVSFEHSNPRTSRGASGGRYVLFEISDTGSGIPEAIREKIFEPFFTTKGSGKGTGLGLASVRSIVESHGGLLNLQTEIGKGTIFRIMIPACEVSQSATPSRVELQAMAA